ncbi:Glycoside hydrolase/deacetylase beta/alpha-barrel [Penicillium angulare]|uniref:Glycoside hydrolase/deacetylase beta/alpha-barrel n=1 Tax=Penicillium angulare TaxID=116970 RepID=UPI0025422DF3|nr:Glycoside hydrolase/deacetylase beta/alpha-barrel [Penicillium angulare]KAJ5288648.1 Glycoside hydrolase/deacetylase beta/alpha-barrel [Penicillium angulare]
MSFRVSFQVLCSIICPLIPAVTAHFHAYVETPNWLATNGSTFHAPENQTPMPALVIDTFQNPTHNDLGFWHGPGEDLPVQHEPGFIRLFPTDPDQNFHTQFNIHGCFSLIPWQKQLLHVVFEGNEEFTVSLNEHNTECYPQRSPFPGTPDSVQASRYVMRTQILSGDDEKSSNDTGTDTNTHAPNTITRRNARRQAQRVPSNDTREDDGDNEQNSASPEKTELFIPLSHFHINHNRVVSVSFSGFYTNVSLTLRRVEIVSAIPPPSPNNNKFIIPEKAPSGKLILRCSRPNSFAFGIDDGQPQYAQEVMRILDEEGVKVTFFAVGAGLRDPTTNFTNFYREMMKKGHQVALHSNTHPKMEALPTLQDIDEEVVRTIQTFHDELNLTSRYFRPPFGTVGARMREALASRIKDPYIVNWSVDVEDWLWGNTSTPEHQLDAFYRSVARGGNLAVMHFLNPSTVGYLPQFIRHIKSAGFKIMRIDQCLEDPNSPPL